MENLEYYRVSRGRKIGARKEEVGRKFNLLLLGTLAVSGIVLHAEIVTHFVGDGGCH